MLQGILINKVKEIFSKQIAKAIGKQFDVLYKKIDKYGKYIEELEKDIAILKGISHPPLFAEKDKKDIVKRINKLEKRR